MPRSTADTLTTILVLIAKGLRTFAYGALGVVFPIHLAALGLGPEAIGGAITATLASTAVLTLAIRRPTERLGPRPVLLGLATLMAAAGVLFATTRSAPIAVAAAMVGNIAVGAGETGPFLSLEQVLLARGAHGGSLTRRMTLYNLVGYGGAGGGSLAVAGLAGGLGSYAAVFWIMAAAGLAQLPLYGLLPTSGRARAARQTPAPAASRRVSPIVRRLAALFALDALAGGFVVQSLVAYWLTVRFGLDLPALGRVFAASQALTVVSLLAAPATVARLGLVETMVFSHLVSNLFLLGLAVAGTAPIAIGLLLARQLLSQMDVPTRQTFLMSVVDEPERPAAAMLTNAARTTAQAVSPTLTGLAMQAVSLSAPFVLGGGLKIVYDLLLYRVARRTRPAGGAPDRDTR